MFQNTRDKSVRLSQMFTVDPRRSAYTLIEGHSQIVGIEPTFALTTATQILHSLSLFKTRKPALFFPFNLWPTQQFIHRPPISEHET